MKQIVHRGRAIVLTATALTAVFLATAALAQIAGRLPATLVHRDDSTSRAQQTPSGNAATQSPYSLPQPTTTTQLSNNLVEFYYVVKTGPGQYDQIGIHHVTLTDKNGNPVPSGNAPRRCVALHWRVRG